MNRLVFVFFLAACFIFLDVYTYYGLRSLFLKLYKWYNVVYFSVGLFTYVSILQLFVHYSGVQNSGVKSEYINFIGGFVFTMLVSKMVFCTFLVLQDGGRFFYGSVQYFRHLLSSSGLEKNMVFIPSRRDFITNTGAMVAGIPFFSLLYGITKGKYQYTVEKISLTFKDLPKSFDGFKIIQISDIHAGSFDNKAKVLHGIDMINSLNADLVCFTGDLVNAEKEEIDPYIDIFAKIQAKFGKFATLGNHDYYGSYDRSDEANEKMYFDDFGNKFKAMGFELLNNASRRIELGGDKINIVGVENWGAGRWFPKKGDLTKATKNIENGEFNVLMSHDPTHWDEKVLSFDKHIHLTLSGHTHGFQFGFQMPGFKWSPAQYRYKKWLGLYQDKNKSLYVNRGFGFLGFPGRVGMWPEITQIVLRCADQS